MQKPYLDKEKDGAEEMIRKQILLDLEKLLNSGDIDSLEFKRLFKDTKRKYESLEKEDT